MHLGKGGRAPLQEGGIVGGAPAPAKPAALAVVADPAPADAPMHL
jgi:hypothetical protein